MSSTTITQIQRDQPYVQQVFSWMDHVVPLILPLELHPTGRGTPDVSLAHWHVDPVPHAMGSTSDDSAPSLTPCRPIAQLGLELPRRGAQLELELSYFA